MGQGRGDSSPWMSASILAFLLSIQQCYGFVELLAPFLAPAPAPAPTVNVMYTAPPGKPSDRPYMVVFGDSHSDNGTGAYPITTEYISRNLAFLMPLITPVSSQVAEVLQVGLGAGNQPPYYKHSSSNGPIWAQYLSGLLSMPLVDYAVNGAVTGGSSATTPYVEDNCGLLPIGSADGGNGNQMVDDAVKGVLGNRPPVPTLLEQVGNYVKQVGPDGASPKAVYFLEAGNNDIFSFVFRNESSSEMSKLARGVGTAVYKAMMQLYSVGARKFVVFDMGLADGVPELHKRGPDAVTKASKLVKASNAAIKAAVNAFVGGTTAVAQQTAGSVGGSNDNTGSGVQVIVFPISIVIGNIMKGYPQNGFADVEHACYNNTSPSFTQPSLVCNRPMAVTCSEPNRYLYWDTFHYTSVVHRLVAQNLAGYVAPIVDAPIHE